MENKAPERKVLLQEEDLFYVYDKRINKCITEGCEGTVKYGLILKVVVSNGETINSYECKKCHMKYTPYPNYVRLSNPQELRILNKEEVEARDLKRAEDAKKQALRDKKKIGYNRGKKSFERSSSHGKKQFGDRPYKKSHNNKPYYSDIDGKNSDNRSFHKSSYDNREYDNREYGKRRNDFKSDYNSRKNDRNYESKSFERKSYDKKYYNNRGYQNREFNEGYGKKSNYNRVKESDINKDE